MKTFEQKLNQFISDNAMEYSKNLSDGEYNPKKYRYSIHGAECLKPIVLKLYNDLHECKAILMRQWGSEEKIRSLTGPPLEIIILDALAEVEKILEGEKND